MSPLAGTTPIASNETGPTSPQRRTGEALLRAFAIAILAAVLMAVAGVPANAAPGDADRDRIPDDVEIMVCGTATCATGSEDRDGDGIPDWVEIHACGTRGCADPKRDSDGDGIPDYAERLVCGTDTCANSREEADGDGIADWVEFVICGDRVCATGDEDYDGDGVSDAAQLAACVKRVDSLAFTGQPELWFLATIGALAVIGGGLLLFQRRAARRDVAAERRVAEVGA